MPDKDLEAAIEAAIEKVRQTTGGVPNFMPMRDEEDAAAWEQAVAEIERRAEEDARDV